MHKLVVVIAYCALASAALVASPAGAKPRGINGKIVFNSDNRVTGQEEVYTVDPDGTDRQFVADAEVGQWSADAGRLALFTRCCGETLVALDPGSFTHLPLP